MITSFSPQTQDRIYSLLSPARRQGQAPARCFLSPVPGRPIAPAIRRSRFVAAESVAEMAVPIYVIGLDADTAQIERSGDFAAIERGGPPTMIGFEQQIAVVRPPRQIHQLVLVWRLRAASVARCSRQGFSGSMTDRASGCGPSIQTMSGLTTSSKIALTMGGNIAC
jgi:hypothetical protein